MLFLFSFFFNRMYLRWLTGAFAVTSKFLQVAMFSKRVSGVQGFSLVSHLMMEILLSFYGGLILIKINSKIQLPCLIW